VAHALNPSTWEAEAEAGRSLSLRSAWSTVSSRTEKPCLKKKKKKKTKETNKLTFNTLINYFMPKKGRRTTVLIYFCSIVHPGRSFFEDDFIFPALKKGYSCFRLVVFITLKGNVFMLM
jgi:hypothetical protein